MTTDKTIQRRYLVVGLYVALAYGLAWIPWCRSLLSGERLQGLFSFGPLLAAFACTVLLHGGHGALDLLKSMGRWRAPLAAYAFALGVPLASLLLVTGLHMALGGSAPQPEALAKWPAALAAFPLIFVFGGPLGEEAGWRGFLLPTLMRDRTPLVAALLTGVIWALWHLPLFLAHKMPPPAGLAMVFGSITFSWLYHYSGRSVFITMLFHAVGNTLGGQYFFGLFPRGEIGQVVVLRIAVELAIALSLAVLLHRMGRTGAPQEPAPR